MEEGIVDRKKKGKRKRIDYTDETYKDEVNKVCLNTICAFLMEKDSNLSMEEAKHIIIIHHQLMRWIMILYKEFICMYSPIMPPTICDS